MKKSCSELEHLMSEYIKDPYSHYRCTYNTDPENGDICEECSCGLKKTIKRFIDWVKFREMHTLK